MDEEIIESLAKEKVEDIITYLIRLNYLRLVQEKDLNDIKHNVSVLEALINILVNYAFKSIDARNQFLNTMYQEIQKIKEKYKVSEASLETNRNNPRTYALIYSRLFSMYSEIKNYLHFVLGNLLTILKPKKYEDFDIEISLNDIEEFKKKNNRENI